jgi:hypothetical protein
LSERSPAWLVAAAFYASPHDIQMHARGEGSAASGTDRFIFRLLGMQSESKKRVEWERLLMDNRTPLFGDLPEELRELLEQLDERLGVKKAKAPRG